MLDLVGVRGVELLEIELCAVTVDVVDGQAVALGFDRAANARVPLVLGLP